MDAGELTREELQRWVANRFYYQECIPLKDAAILSNCPEVEVRREWIHADHRPRRHRRRHAAGSSPGCGSARRSACRARSSTSERRVLPAVRYAVDAYVNFARQRPWIEAVASSLTELFGPARDPRAPRGARGATIRGSTRPGLQYFRDRLEQAPRDAEYALGLVVERCRTREQQERAVAALKFKTEMLWAQLEAIERGDTQPPAAP